MNEYRWGIIGTIINRGREFSPLDLEDIFESFKYETVTGADIEAVIQYGLDRGYCRETDRENIYRYSGSMSREIGIGG